MSGTETAIDAAGLETYLSGELDIDVGETRVLNDGLNLTLVISTANDEQRYVLRRPNKLRRTDLFIGVKREYRVLRALGDASIPTPEPVLFCDDASVIGNSFFVTTFLEGSTIPLGSDLPERFQNETSRNDVAANLIETLAAIHSLDVSPFEECCNRQSPLNQIDRATARLDETATVTGREFPLLRSVAEWLRQNVPEESKRTVVHGDFRPGNVLFAAGDSPEITGVLDWETAMIGDPQTELGYLLLRWRDENDPTPPLDELEARYSNEDAIQQLRAANENGLAPFTMRPGSPSRRELVTRYEDETGIEFENERFYRAHAALMLATVWADLHRHRIEAGNESHWEPHVEYMARIAHSIVTGEFEL
ncbi:phosphotransferase family protein [Natrialba sp. PRR66]|uniref:phosphotransferase family protein n=1 Tax=Natrialba sp. PRR66 TaxID=3098146 RepID=UPI002B1DB8F8|nr:phosphotransferase family protein [Natrialba sp. PRR66]